MSHCSGCEYLDVSLTAVSCAVLMCSKVNITFWQYLWNYFFPGSNINAFSLNCQRSQLSAKRNFASRAFFSNQITTSLFVFPSSFDLFSCYLSLKSLANKSTIPQDLRIGLSLPISLSQSFCLCHYFSLVSVSMETPCGLFPAGYE